MHDDADDDGDAADDDDDDGDNDNDDDDADYDYDADDDDDVVDAENLSFYIDFDSHRIVFFASATARVQKPVKRLPRPHSSGSFLADAAE